MHWLKEPLLHFILIGLGLFALYGWLNPDKMASDQAIVVSAGRVETLAANFSRTWNRPPSGEELRKLVDAFVLEEIYYRQALELGLDRDDPVVRRRMRQKLEFMTADISDSLQPSSAQLQAYLDAHPDQFRQGPRISFEQLYFPADSDPAEVVAAKARLNAGEPVAGSQTLLPAAMEAASAFSIDRQFGEGFSSRLESRPLDEWSGPVDSGFGLHLVRVSAIEPGFLPPLDAVAREVEREWRAEQAERIRQQTVESLLADYKVSVQWPATLADEGSSS